MGMSFKITQIILHRKKEYICHGEKYSQMNAAIFQHRLNSMVKLSSENKIIRNKDEGKCRK